MSGARWRSGLTLIAAVCVTMGGATARAGTAPAPTVTVTMATPPDGHRMPYPGDPAQWSVARPGRDATLAARLETATESDLLATWTSAPLRASGPGPLLSLVIERSYLQADPAEEGDLLTVQARYHVSSRGGWTPWTTPISTWLGMGAERGGPDSLGGTASYTVPYVGKAAVSGLVVQLRIALKADRAGYLETSLHVTA